MPKNKAESLPVTTSDTTPLLPTRHDALDFTEGQHVSLDAATGMIRRIWKIVEKSNLDEIRVESTKDLYNLSNSISGLAKAVEGIERSARDRRQLQAGVREELVHAIRHELRQHPELVKQFLDVIEKTSSETLLGD